MKNCRIVKLFNCGTFYTNFQGLNIGLNSSPLITKNNNQTRRIIIESFVLICKICVNF